MRHRKQEFQRYYLIDLKDRPCADNERKIQSPFGHEITPAAIMDKVGEVDSVYIRVDQNKLYWVKGEENGSVDIW